MFVDLKSPELAPPTWLYDALLPAATKVGLPKLAEVAHIVLFFPSRYSRSLLVLPLALHIGQTCVASFVLQGISHVVCPRLFPKYYPQIPAKQNDWDLHVVGWAYSLLSVPLALALIINPSKGILSDPLYGYGVAEGRLSAIATGYFMWDAWVSGKHISTQGLGFFLHGAGCCVAFLFTLAPFLLFCGPNFLIWELSTIFLNMHWYLDKFQMTGSTFQLINGGFLLASYVGARLIWGTYQSYVCLSLLYANPQVGPIRYLYGTVNVMLNSLNFFWFRSMIFALKKRFVKADPNARKEAIEVDGKLSWKKDKKKQ